VLGEVADDLLSGVVGGGDEVAINGINQAGPVTLQKGEGGFDVWGLGDESVPLGQDLLITPLGGPFGVGLENLVNALP
jgi:hypothetical protein